MNSPRRVFFGKQTAQHAAPGRQPDLLSFQISCNIANVSLRSEAYPTGIACMLVVTIAQLPREFALSARDQLSRPAGNQVPIPLLSFLSHRLSLIFRRARTS